MQSLDNDIAERISRYGRISTDQRRVLAEQHGISDTEIDARIDKIVAADDRLHARRRLVLGIISRIQARRARPDPDQMEALERSAAAVGWDRAHLDWLIDDLVNQLSGEDIQANESQVPATGTSDRNRARPLAVVAMVLLALVLVGFLAVPLLAPPPDPADTSAWQQAESFDSMASYRDYLAQWPDGVGAETARNRLVRLARESEAASLARVERAREYLQRLGYDVPDRGELDGEMRTLLAEALPRVGNLDVVDETLLAQLREAWQLAEADVWQRAQPSDNAVEDRAVERAALMDYLKRYPDGEFRPVALQRVEDIDQARQRARIIEQIQQELVRLGRSIEVTGQFDDPTRDALLAFVAGNGRVAEPAPSQNMLDRLIAAEHWPYRDGERFRECPECPEMVVIPGGRFIMGSPEYEVPRSNSEGPQRPVEVARFALARTEVTFDQWDRCVDAGGCSYRPEDGGWGRGDRPVVNVTWNDAQEYVRWLRSRTGAFYRLPSEAEWEYAARSGTATRFSTGACITSDEANFDGRLPSGTCPESDYRGRTVPVARFEANAFGLYDMHGNVAEWTQDCWNADYAGAPSDGSIWDEGDCSRSPVRGGSWSALDRQVRSAARVRPTGALRNAQTGFRPARRMP